MSKSIRDAGIYEILQNGLSLSVLKKSRKQGTGNSVSIALSESDGHYISGKVESDTNLLDITSEHVALLRATQHQDYEVREVITLVDNNRPLISPLVLKLLTDFGKRTGKIVAYKVLNQNGETVFKTDDPSSEIGFYQPEQEKLRLPHNAISKNSAVQNKNDKPETTLKLNALKGLNLAFRTYDGASSYGASVITGNGTVYYSGQYSAAEGEKRLGIHAEMTAILAALMSGERIITHLGLISDKFKDKPCTLCGCCRQFILELSRIFSWDIPIYCFAKDTDDYKQYVIDELIPDSWDSKKWQ